MRLLHSLYRPCFACVVATFLTGCASQSYRISQTTHEFGKPDFIGWQSGDETVYFPSSEPPSFKWQIESLHYIYTDLDLDIIHLQDGTRQFTPLGDLLKEVLLSRNTAQESPH